MSTGGGGSQRPNGNPKPVTKDKASIRAAAWTKLTETLSRPERTPDETHKTLREAVCGAHIKKPQGCPRPTGACIRTHTSEAELLNLGATPAEVSAFLGSVANGPDRA